MEAHVTRSLDSVYDRAKQAVMLETDRPHVLREMIYVCRPGGRAFGSRRLRRPGRQDSVRRDDEQGPDDAHRPDPRQPLDRRPAATGSSDGQIDPSFVITHSVALEDGPEMYKTFRDKEDGCIKVVLKP